MSFTQLKKRWRGIVRRFLGDNLARSQCPTRYAWEDCINIAKIVQSLGLIRTDRITGEMVIEGKTGYRRKLIPIIGKC